MRRLRFDDTKRIMSAEINPQSFGTFEKRARSMNLLLPKNARRVRAGF